MDSRDSGDAIHREGGNRRHEHVGVSNANDVQDRGMIACESEK